MYAQYQVPPKRDGDQALALSLVKYDVYASGTRQRPLLVKSGIISSSTSFETC